MKVLSDEENRNAYQREWYANSPEFRSKKNERARTRYASDPAVRQKARERELRRLYGLSPAEYEALLLWYGGRCALCPSSDHLAIDHDHECCPDRSSCGECIRGLLCKRCNVGLGSFADDSERLQRAAEYVGGATWRY